MWNWEYNNWPNFDYEQNLNTSYEEKFLIDAGKLLGANHLIDESDRQNLVIELMSEEALKSSEIEGEYLNRDSIRASLRRQFGLATDHRKVDPGENGMAEMLLDIYQNFEQPLNHETLFSWHSSLMSGRTDLETIGGYRRHQDPMQIVSGSVYNPNIHFEAPPSNKMQSEMDAFINWFNSSSPEGISPIPALLRAGIAHIYFVSIHPFEDGNGRIARALSEKVLSQHLRQPALIAISHAIEKAKKSYYEQLEENQSGLKIDTWISYFSKTAMIAIDRSKKLTRFVIDKAKLFDCVRDQLNARQEKVLLRMFREGIDGFKGGLSAKNYISITDTYHQQATRDLAKLVEMGALMKEGKGKGTRYHLNFG